MTLEEASRSFALLAEKLQRKVYGNAIRVGVRMGAKWALKKVRSHGLGEALWTNRNSKRKGISGTPPLIVVAKRVRLSDGIYKTGIETHGIAALIELGGRIAPHKITPKRAPRLAFEVGGGWTFPKAVNHPGAPVQRYPFIEDAGRVAETEIPRAIDAGIDKAVAETGLA